MHVRDALESDTEAIASLADRPLEATRDRIHGRTVRVAVTEDTTADGELEVVGFLAFDARNGAVHVTDFEGTPEAVRRLLQLPIEFAEREGMDVETTIRNDERERIEAIEGIGFVATEAGPRFEGHPTTRFRLELKDEGAG